MPTLYNHQSILLPGKRLDLHPEGRSLRLVISFEVRIHLHWPFFTLVSIYTPFGPFIT